jgi:hypothetical protein
MFDITEKANLMLRAKLLSKNPKMNPKEYHGKLNFVGSDRSIICRACRSLSEAYGADSAGEYCRYCLDLKLTDFPGNNYGKQIKDYNKYYEELIKANDRKSA